MSIIASEDKPLLSESELSDPGPRDSFPGSDEGRLLIERMGDVQAAALRRNRERRRRVDAAPAGRVLAPEGAPRVSALAAELFREARGRWRFAVSPGEEFSAMAGILVRYRIRSLYALRQTQKDARTLFLMDVREVDRLKFPAMQLLLRVLGHFPPRMPQARPSDKDPAYEKLVITERPKGFKVDLSATAGLLRPVLNSPSRFLLCGEVMKV